LLPLEPDYKTLIRLNLWAVVDGHGGGCVATYVSEVLLPHIAASVSRALGCAMVDRGVCTVNGQRRNANALDLDGLIQMTAEQSPGNPNSIHYRSPYERSDSGDEGGGDAAVREQSRRARTNVRLADHSTGGDDETSVDLLTDRGGHVPLSPVPRLVSGETSLSFPDSIIAQPGGSALAGGEDQTTSSVKTSVKTAASPATREDLVGTHSPAEVAAITRAITESFLAVDEGWINSIDPVATHQTSCHSNGRWNSGACALVVFTVQRLDWTSVAEPGRAKEQRDPEKSRLNTSQNRDAARRRMLDYATRTKATTTTTTASTTSVGSSTSSLTTEETAHASGIESEITETEGEDDRSFCAESRHRETERTGELRSGTHHKGKRSFISPSGGGCSSSHCYRAHDAIIYTAHVGDCRAVMLGSAPPRTIKVGGYATGTRSSTRGDADVTDDEESSHHSSDETECLSSSDHEAESSEDEDLDRGTTVQAANIAGAPPTSEFITLPPRRVARDKSAKRRAIDDAAGPYIALPPLDEEEERTVDIGLEMDVERRERRRLAGKDAGTSDSSTTSQESLDVRPLLLLPPGTRPIDLTTDHSAYNPAEVTAVLRRCNNAPKAISAGMGGGIKRVAGSLAVTRALGDAYLKTPKLSFLPYKKHAPYITARPEVNCRLLVKEGDKVLILATDVCYSKHEGMLLFHVPLTTSLDCF
jgi:serine/threonine protein phosphatase PrpC